MLTDPDIIRAAQARARVYAGSNPADSDPTQAALDGYQADALTCPDYDLRRDLWNKEQELLYRFAFAGQLLLLGL